MDKCLQEEERKGRQKGSTAGNHHTSDVLRHRVQLGPVNIHEYVELEEPPNGRPTTGSTNRGLERL